MDSRSVYSHKSMMVDNSNRWYIVARSYVSIQRMGFQVSPANMYTPVDGFFLRNEHSLHTNQYHRLFGIHDSIDHKLHHPNSLRCIGKCLVHMKSMDFPAYQLGKYNWLDDFVPNIQLRVRIEFHHMCMGWNISRCSMPCRMDNPSWFYIPLQVEKGQD